MYKFKKGDSIIVYGCGKISNKYYNNVPAIILERDLYFKDYHVKFQDETDDWILAENLSKLERKWK